MSNGGPQQVQIQIPPQIIAQIKGQTLNAAAIAIVTGDYEGSEVVPISCKKIIGDMLLTLAGNRGLETAKCEHCTKIRLEHDLDLKTGDRTCAAELQTKPTPETPNPAKKIFSPVVPKVVAPSESERRIILTGR